MKKHEEVFCVFYPPLPFFPPGLFVKVKSQTSPPPLSEIPHRFRVCAETPARTGVSSQVLALFRRRLSKTRTAGMRVTVAHLT